MQRDTPSDDESSADAHSNRRRFLKGVGAAAVGTVAVTGTASAQKYQFDGCRAVYSDTHADIAVVETDDGVECRSITEEADSEEVPWDWGAYRYEAEPGEVLIGAVEEDAWQGRDLFSQWSCELELNPSGCAGRFYESEYQVKSELNDNEDCGDCSGLIVSGDGEGVTTVEGNENPDDDDASDDDLGFSDMADADDEDAAARTEPETEAETDDVEATSSITGSLRGYLRARFGR